MTYSFPPHYGSGVKSVTNRDKGSRCLGLATLPPSCADCLEILGASATGGFRASPVLYKDCFTFICSTSESVIYSRRKTICAVEWKNGNVEVQWKNIKKCVLDNMTGLAEKSRQESKKATDYTEVIIKMDERGYWKNINKEKVKKNYIILRNELKSPTDKAIFRIYDEMMKFQRTENYYLMYLKTKT
jgi:hypothetical protein